MKRLPLLHVIAAALLTISACQKEPMSPTDPLPFPSDQNKDLSVQPGDNFFLYCNGSWLKKAVLPAGKRIVGGLPDAVRFINNRKAELMETDPLLADIMASAKDPDAREKNQAYIEKLIAMVPDPKDPSVTQEDYARFTGKLYRMGMEDLLTVVASEDNGILVPYVLPDIFSLIAPEERPAPEPGAPKSKKFMKLLCEGLEIPYDLLVWDPITLERDEYSDYLTLSKEEIAEGLKKAIRKLDMGIEEITNKVPETASIYIEYIYTKQNVPAGLKEQYTAVAERMKAQYRKRIQALDWMSDATKASAIEKLDAMSVNVAYPDNWREHLLPTLEKTKACESLLEKYLYLVSCCECAYYMDLFGKNARESIFDSKIASGYKISNAGGQYSTQSNAIFICSGILLPPMLPADVTEAYTYAVFSIIGHELTHGFDSDGAGYDKDGNRKNWWTVADRMAFEDRMLLLIDCYNHLEVAPDIMPGRYCNGEVTLEENIADLGGVNIAFDAYTESLQEQGYFGKALQDQQRKFFESYADIWCCKYGEEHIKNRMDGKKPDSHALPQERINGVVMNMDVWYDLYGVTRENKLYLPPEKRTRIW